jgi:hypothetical protein
MGKLIVMNGLSLDGVMQGPGRPDDDQRTQFLLSRGTLSAAGGAPAVPLIACRPASTGASGRSLAPEDTRVLAGPTRGGPCRLVPVARGAVDQLGRCQDARLADGRG